MSVPDQPVPTGPPHWRWDYLVGGPRDGEVMRLPWGRPNVNFPRRRPVMFRAGELIPSDDPIQFDTYVLRTWGCPSGLLELYVSDSMTDDELESSMWRRIMHSIGANPV